MISEPFKYISENGCYQKSFLNEGVIITPLSV